MASNMPAWLPSYLIAGGFLVVALLTGLVLSFHPRFKNRYRGRPATAQPTLFQKRTRGPSVMSTSVVGLLHFKPAGWLIWPICGVALGLFTVQLPLLEAVPATAALLLVVVIAYLRPKRAVQCCYVDENGALTLMRRDVTIPFDLNHFRYVRLYNAEWRDTESSTPGMLVLRRDTRPSPWTWLSSVLLPRVDDERVVLFCSRWWDADGYFVGPRDMAALFFQACERAGRLPTILNHFFGSDGWEVRPS
ncbi:hypothetical protein [Mycobacterium sp. 1164966.3]|uniref:hypothetical protein n=1 Tax=Mycobacterium sp. 1164966.3 TaxID=1856861 RepID=UPI0012E7F86A|nr:hypothetical protein [Mycobacterium sp. 1164966.3]